MRRFKRSEVIYRSTILWKTFAFATVFWIVALFLKGTLMIILMIVPLFLTIWIYRNPEFVLTKEGMYFGKFKKFVKFEDIEKMEISRWYRGPKFAQLEEVPEPKDVVLEPTEKLFLLWQSPGPEILVARTKDEGILHAKLLVRSKFYLLGEFEKLGINFREIDEKYLVWE